MNKEQKRKEDDAIIKDKQYLRRKIIELLNHRIYLQRGLSTQNEANRIIDQEIRALKTVVDILSDDIRTRIEELDRF